MASRTLTAATPEEAATIRTADPVDELGANPVDAAPTNGKPTVVLFAAAALCTSRVWGRSPSGICCHIRATRASSAVSSACHSNG